MRVLSALLLGLTTICATANAKPLPAQDKVTIVTEDWPPFNYTLPDGDIGGIASTKVKNIMSDAGIEFEISMHPWDEAYKLAKNGTNVLIYTIIRSKEREQDFKWVCPLTQPVTLFYFTRADRMDVQVSDENDLHHYRIGVTRSEFAHTYLLEKVHVDKTQLLVANDNQQNLRRMLNSEVDLVVESVPSIKQRLKRMGESYTSVRPAMEVRTADVPPNCMAFGLKTPDIVVQRVRLALQRVNRTK